MMRRYFDDDDEVHYYPPAWYLWPLWWIALPVLVAIDKIQVWIVTRNLWRTAEPGMDAILRNHFGPDLVDNLAKKQDVEWENLTSKDPEDGTD